MNVRGCCSFCSFRAAYIAVLPEPWWVRGCCHTHHGEERRCFQPQTRRHETEAILVRVHSSVQKSTPTVTDVACHRRPSDYHHPRLRQLRRSDALTRTGV